MTFTVEKINKPWQSLDLIWRGGEELVKTGLPHSQLPPAWQILLLGDGAPTRHLRLLTAEKITVDVIDMSLVGNDTDNAPADIEKIPSPRLRRQVWLKTESGKILAYASSWWEAVMLMSIYRIVTYPFGRVYLVCTRNYIEIFRESITATVKP